MNIRIISGPPGMPNASKFVLMIPIGLFFLSLDSDSRVLGRIFLSLVHLALHLITGFFELPLSLS